MSQKFEVLKTQKTATNQLRKTVRNLRGVPEDLKLDPSRGQALGIGLRQWTFIMTREAAAGWRTLGRERITLGVLASGLDRPYLQRVLIALPGSGDTVKLEMHDNDGHLLWSGIGRLDHGDLVFSMPITRPRVKAKGMMAGRLSGKGRLVLSDSRLPRPARKHRPTFESED